MSEPDNGRTVVIVAYVLHLVGAVSGILSIVGLIVNYVSQGEHGELAHSHHTWMIRTFWWSFLWFILVGIVAALTWILIIGIVVAAIGFPVIWFWYVYRHVRGLITFTDGKSMPA